MPGKKLNENQTRGIPSPSSHWEQGQALLGRQDVFKGTMSLC